ncbi:MAG: NAD(P)-dependent oxidoreductase [Rhizobiaceae bacterium]
MSDLTVAVLGTGLMGAPMARNLLKGGYAVRAWNRSREKAEPLAKYGAQIFDTAAKAADGADVVITMLSDGPATSDVLFAQGVAGSMKTGAIVVDMGSIKPAEAKDHAERLKQVSLRYIDAPVSGGTRGAEEGSLAIMAGGEQADFEEVEPVLSAMGRPVRVGPTGAGQLAKLCNQVIVAITIGCVAEAMLLMERNGGDPAKLRDALKGGFADSTILQQHGERMTTGNFVPGGLSRLQVKDLDNALEVMRQADLELPIAEQTRERFQRLITELDGGELDHSALYLELLDINGLKPNG